MTSQDMPRNVEAHHQLHDIAQQQTISCPAVSPSSLTGETALTGQVTQPQLLSTPFASATTLEPSSDDPTEDKPDEEIKGKPKKPEKPRLVIILAILVFGCAIYFIWRTPATNSSVAPIPSPSFSTSTSKGDTASPITTNSPGGTIQVYVTGAIQHPGVYTLSNDARVYQLLQVAGGPLPDANLIALNLAEKLVDGQEIYISRVGETPPVIGSTGNNQGQLVNINTASAADLQQKLHLSAKSAQSIISYRQQHGAFKSIDQLLQVVTQTIYNKIKGQITV